MDTPQFLHLVVPLWEDPDKVEGLARILFLLLLPFILCQVLIVLVFTCNGSWQFLLLHLTVK